MKVWHIFALSFAGAILLTVCVAFINQCPSGSWSWDKPAAPAPAAPAPAAPAFERIRINNHSLYTRTFDNGVWCVWVRSGGIWCKEPKETK